jgi:glutathione S-transferase
MASPTTSPSPPPSFSSSSSSSSTPVRLLTIPCSHYCEKARWALDWFGIPFVEEGHAAGAHMLATRSVGASSVPVLINGELILKDSTDIISWAERHISSSSSSQHLLPLDPTLRTRALELEEYFDVKLGPATRVVAYHHILEDKSLAMRLISPSEHVPTWERLSVHLLYGVLASKMRQGMNINEESCNFKLKMIDEIFSKVAILLEVDEEQQTQPERKKDEGEEKEEQKEEGKRRSRSRRRYLVGDSFSVADLTFAVLASPLLLPAEIPLYRVLESKAPPSFGAIIDKYRNTIAGQFALRLFVEERRPQQQLQRQLSLPSSL